ncbi:hypothetical protein EMIHUDRAFT_204618 [Emiliania huxleyi CCMP1516]|uniref:Ankyrin repeat protein n=2 Tax=Emiliania huxleyi TaxID=2903 RepID=A0A0D3JW09_EMIH1|nr:hypothetical protein EMIHUDRAFT_204618 [Emiliania huxleyi CCMP1516]EOD27694.1 hypothetical protein EMIHUDRAFT_204618 [Emiliania huxleyi CCMP1516]|eukprot:XP_005780123.1 hypothetical protein EMIHUDRAFT_204618 [Emiliania huxleyi CCMP1516]
MAFYFDAASRFDLSPQPLDELISSGQALSRRDGSGRTLLHHACEQGHEGAVRALVEAGCSVEAQDCDGRTPLHLACLNVGRASARGSDHLAIVRFLEESNASATTPDRFGRLPLSCLPDEAKRVGRNAGSMRGPALAATRVITGSPADPAAMGGVAGAVAAHTR